MILATQVLFLPKAPTIAKAVNSVAEEAEVLPVGLDGPGFSFFKRIGVVREVVGFDFP